MTPIACVLMFYGQTMLAAGQSIDNPVSNRVALPYVVPPGETLVVETYGVEGYDSPGIMVIFPYKGPCGSVECRLDNSMASVAARDGSNQFTGLHWVVEAGEELHVRLQNGQQLNAVYGWFLQARREPCS